MTDKVFDNNHVGFEGAVESDFAYSHDVFGEGFYLMEISVNRLSDTFDTIPVMVSERLLNVKESCKGKFVEINGQFRSYNRHEDNKNRLVLSVFAREVKLYEKTGEEQKPNYIFLDGFVCKQPVYRKTPLGREIADILLAVNRPYGKSDYIPCICWGRNARFADSFEVGAHLQVWGRIQSREYQKKLSETEFEKRVAYEVSVSKLDLLEAAEE
ncbi:MAG: single-stranded DNA-binding protein [Lachnospiraceae bacterium]|nr:single-stranded DNA-binding protein [Lachnospiraceae bacterium]